jgi:predicted SAM-dependent methyltransferase
MGADVNGDRQPRPPDAPRPSIRTSKLDDGTPVEGLQKLINEVYLKHGVPIPGSRRQQFLARLVPPLARNAVRRMATDVLSPWERRKANALLRHSRAPLRLHLGAGELPRADWVNVDLYGVPQDLFWNLKRPLPFPDGTVNAIFHEHVLEHLPGDFGLALTRECWRVLEPGGVLRIGVPDARRHIGWYVDGQHPAYEHPPTALVPLLRELYGFGHRVMYDFETLALLCHAAGFEVVEERPFGDSRLEPAPDHEWRRWDSLYVESLR